MTQHAIHRNSHAYTLMQDLAAENTRLVRLNQQSDFYESSLSNSYLY